MSECRHERISSREICTPAGMCLDCGRSLKDIVSEQREQVEKLKRWKKEAIEVITRWDDVYEWVVKNPRLGESKSTLVLERVAELEAALAERNEAHRPKIIRINGINYRDLGDGEWVKYKPIEGA